MLILQSNNNILANKYSMRLLSDDPNEETCDQCRLQDGGQKYMFLISMLDCYPHLLPPSL